MIEGLMVGFGMIALIGTFVCLLGFGARAQAGDPSQYDTVQPVSAAQDAAEEQARDEELRLLHEYVTGGPVRFQ